MNRVKRTLILVGLVVLIVPRTALGWAWPAGGDVLRPFHFGDDPYAGGQHRGVDIGGALGSAVAAPVAGLVSFAGPVPGNGVVVTIRTDDGYAVTLAQLGAALVERGRMVAEGDTVGSIGTSVEADVVEPHVHLGVRIAADEEGYVDPLGLLPARPQSQPQPVAPAEPPGAGVAALETGEPPAATGEQATIVAVVPEPDVPSVTAAATPAPTAPGSPRQTETPPVRTHVVQRRLGSPTGRAVLGRSTEESTPVSGRAPTNATPRQPRTVHAAGGATPRLGHTAPRPAMQVSGARAARTIDPIERVEASPSAALQLSQPRRPRDRSWIGRCTAILLALLAAGAVVWRRARSGRRGAPIMVAHVDAPEDPRRGRLAVCERPASHRSRGGIRRPGGRVRPLPPPPGGRRADGQRHRRARHPDHGRGRRRGRLPA